MSNIKNTDDLDIVGTNVVFYSFIYYDLYDIEPRARSDYDTSPSIKEASKIHGNIINSIKEYCNKNNINMNIEDTGDWDDISIGIYIPIDTLNLSFEESVNMFHKLNLI